MRIESLRVQNYKVLRDVRLENVSPMAVLLGANGSGKSTLLDVFAFLRDCVRYDVTEAVDRRGGFNEVVSRGETDPIEIGFRFRLQGSGRLFEYSLHIAKVDDDVYVKYEHLLDTTPGLSADGRLLVLSGGSGTAMPDKQYRDPHVPRDYDNVAMVSTRVLGLKAFGQDRRYPVLAAFRNAIEEWHHSTLRFERAVRGNGVRLADHLAPNGENLEGVAYFLYNADRSRFDEVVRKMQRQVPGLRNVEPFTTEDRRVILRFADGSFKDPFRFDAASEGTRKLFALMLMLHEPEPHPLLTVEEPENDLYPQIVRPLAEEFRDYAERGSQVFVSTHSPDFVNALNLDELYWMEKRDGFAHVVHAKDDPNLVAQHVEGELLGSLWREGFLGKVDPL